MQYIIFLCEPAFLITGSIIVFYGFEWILDKVADWLGIEDYED